MKESIKHIMDVVCEICDIDPQMLNSKSKVTPLPLFRGFYWYTIRRAIGVSNATIAKLVSCDEYQYTSAGIGLGISRAINALTKEKYWQDCWERVAETLDLPRGKKHNSNITLVMYVPHGMKNKFKVEIKEK